MSDEKQKQNNYMNLAPSACPKCGRKAMSRWKDAAGYVREQCDRCGSVVVFRPTVSGPPFPLQDFWIAKLVGAPSQYD